MDFENQIHGYRWQDIREAWEKIRFNDGQNGERVDVPTPTQHKGVGLATFIFDGERWVLKSVR